MSFDLPHAPLDSPHFRGTPTAPTPSVSDESEQVANMRVVQALARKPPPDNRPIQLLHDVRGRGTTNIDVVVIGWQGRPISSDVPADTEVYVWNQAAHAWELVPACFLGQQSDGDDLVQVSNGAGGFAGVINHVVPGTYPAANVTVDKHGLILGITSGVLAGTIPDAPSDGVFYGRHNAAWGAVAPLASPVFTGNPTAPTPPASDNDNSLATTSFVKSQNYLLGNQTVTLTGDATGSGTTTIPLTLASVSTPGTVSGITFNAKGLVIGAVDQGYLTNAVAATIYASIFSPVFTGNPRGPTPAPSDNDDSLATTAYVKSQGYATSTEVLGTPALGLIATGGDAATALILTADFNEFLTIPAGAGARIPSYMTTPLRRCRVAAYDITSQENLLLYPLAGQTFYYGGVANIDGGGNPLPLTVLSGNVLEVQAVSATKVYVVSST